MPTISPEMAPLSHLCSFRCLLLYLCGHLELQRCDNGAISALLVAIAQPPAVQMIKTVNLNDPEQISMLFPSRKSHYRVYHRSVHTGSRASADVCYAGNQGGRSSMSKVRNDNGEYAVLPF